ncbi:hypothetical protein OV207_08980 [Corallococcus sp. BB11-1]|uniref:hypothetical protein n=1 Tax=Corallococcus sp. BB11-1 TaxID=2996783 RepID=UPI002271AAC6|nr:hypothetical protein [Corallococcus sp. BB11-1]MCY1031583.1 hypothetical protein [Corallococcus sp. BB11-1]
MTPPSNSHKIVPNPSPPFSPGEYEKEDPRRRPPPEPPAPTPPPPTPPLPETETQPA